MSKVTFPPNRITELCKQANMSVRLLANEAGISFSRMDRIAKGKALLSINELMSVCGILDVNSTEIYGIKLPKRTTASLDDVMFGSIIIWFIEACASAKLSLTSTDLTWGSKLIHDAAKTKGISAMAIPLFAKMVALGLGRRRA